MNPPTGNGKVLAAGASGAVMTIIAYALHAAFHLDLPGEVLAAGQTLITGAAVYFTPHGGA